MFECPSCKRIVFLQGKNIKLKTVSKKLTIWVECSCGAIAAIREMEAKDFVAHRLVSPEELLNDEE